MKHFAFGLVAAILTVSSAIAAEPAKTMETSLGDVYTDQNGMTLYTFDKDSMGATVSACADTCIENWPPFLAAEGAMADGDWTILEVKDKDGVMKNMWAYDGHPLYLFVKDSKPGDVTGDGAGGVWHAAKAE